MRRLFLPIALLGLGGFGLLLLTQRGRNRLRWLFDNLHRAPNALLAWNDAVERELDRIQDALDRVAESLEQPPQIESRLN